MFNVETVSISIISALITSTLSAIITVKLSIKQFRTQKWWELKANAYSNVLESLSYLQYYFSQWFDHSVGNIKISDAHQKELLNKYNSVIESVTKSAATYILNDEASTALTKLIREVENKSFSHRMANDFDECCGLVNECINIVRENATKELKK